MSQTWRERYGPWAVVVGASEGIGAACAEGLARRGLHLVLVARWYLPARLARDGVGGGAGPPPRCT